MFYHASSLAELDLSNFDTSKVTDMNYMFASMSSLVKLNIDSFDTSNVTNMARMFYNTSSLAELDLSSFDTSKVTDMSHMFNLASKLTSITYGPKFIYANNADIFYMFNSCPANRPTDPSWKGVLEV